MVHPRNSSVDVVIAVVGVSVAAELCYVLGR